MKNRYYIYIHKDFDGIVFYIGRGQGDRAFLKTNRNLEHLEKMKQGFTVEYLFSELSLQDAIEKESELLRNPDESWKLLNKIRNQQQIEYCPKYFSKYFQLSKTSPSGLEWTAESKNLIKRRKTGNNVGRVSSHGYYYVSLNGKHLPCHRIVWCLFHNQVLDKNMVIDHIDGDGLNNDPSNLDCITQQENIRRGKQRNRKTGLNGVGWDSARMAWKIQWRENFKVKSKRFLVRNYNEDTFEEEKARVLEIALAFSKTISSGQI